MRHIFVAILVVMTVSICASAQCSDADRQKLEAWDKALGEASRGGDRAFLQSAYTDDFRSLSPSGVMLTKAQTIENALRDSERARGNPAAPAPARYDFYDITCTPNTAVISHRVVTVVRQADGKERTQYARAIHFLERRGGNWMMVSTAGHPITDAAQLLYMQREWSEASKGKDWAWFERNFADDATFVSYRTGTLQTKAEAIADFKNFRGNEELFELSDMSTRVEGDTAVVTGVLRLKGRDERGQPFDHRFRFTDTLVKRDGRWQVLASHGTMIAPPAGAQRASARQ